MRRLFFGVPKGMLLLLLGLLCQTPARAQFWDTVYRLLNGDSTQGPDYDTAYVVSYRDDLVLSPVMAHQSNTLSLDRRDGRSLDFSTNTPSLFLSPCNQGLMPNMNAIKSAADEDDRTG